MAERASKGLRTDLAPRRGLTSRSNFPWTSSPRPINSRSTDSAPSQPIVQWMCMVCKQWLQTQNQGFSLKSQRSESSPLDRTETPKELTQGAQRTTIIKEARKVAKAQNEVQIVDLITKSPDHLQNERNNFTFSRIQTNPESYKTSRMSSYSVPLRSPRSEQTWRSSIRVTRALSPASSNRGLGQMTNVAHVSAHQPRSEKTTLWTRALEVIWDNHRHMSQSMLDHTVARRRKKDTRKAIRWGGMRCTKI